MAINLADLWNQIDDGCLAVHQSLDQKDRDARQWHVKPGALLDAFLQTVRLRGSKPLDPGVSEPSQQ